MKKSMTLKEHAKLPARKAHGPNAAGFKKGGPTSEDRMRLGRNLSRAANQKTG